MFGFYRPFPMKFGGGKPLSRIYHEGIRAALPSALTREAGTRVDLESMVQSRMVAACWEAYDRWRANQFPHTSLELLPRWAERLGVPVRAQDSVEEIRAACVAKYQLDVRGSTPGAIRDAVQLLLADLSPVISWGSGDLDNPPTDTYWPDNPGTEAWTSSRNLMSIEVTPPESMSADQVSYLMDVRLFEILDGALGADRSFTWSTT